MEPEERDDPRAANDSRKTKTPVEPAKEAPMENKPSMRQRWNNMQPSKMATFWIALVSVVAVLIIGFNWGGWMTAGGAEEQAQTMAKTAVIERLAPICVAQFNLDPENIMKLDELSELSSSQRPTYVQEQGWATITGEDRPRSSGSQRMHQVNYGYKSVVNPAFASLAPPSFIVPL